MRKTTFFSLFLIVFLSILQADSEKEFPVLYKGRYRPAEAYARLWLYENYHAQELKTSHLPEFHTVHSSALDFLWSIEHMGGEAYKTSPLFWISSATMKQSANLPLHLNRFSYEELQHAFYENDRKFADEWTTIMMQLTEFERLSSIKSIDVSFQNRWKELQVKGMTSQEIGKILEQEYPFMQRLRSAGSLFHSLPSRYKEGDWYPIHALALKIHDSSLNALVPIGNFTRFTDLHFVKLRQAYVDYHQAMLSSSSTDQQEDKRKIFTQILQEAYLPLAGTAFQKAHEKQLYYPSMRQLKIEALYVDFPWIPLLIFLYVIGALLLVFSYHDPSSTLYRFALGFIFLAILCHTGLLAARSYILGRPPVSNMFETVIYVPWVGVCVSLFFLFFRKQPLVLLASSCASILLLLVISFADLHQGLDQVQAVLDSQFWLLIHVLMIVGSYGIFILGALLAHFYLIQTLIHRKETAGMAAVGQIILQTLYIGTTLLITGTLLGGVWAAESWGRFWDWDPKESWAFISSCFYLIWIHAYRFQYIRSFGLAIGAITGLLAISFTWYGVNYVLGTGLHSYGFGSGGEMYYYLFIGIECLFLTLLIYMYARQHIHTPQSVERNEKR